MNGGNNLGEKKKKKILTIVKSLLSIKFWSLSIKDPTTGRNRTSAGEMDVFKKRGIPFKLHLLQDEDRNVDILRKLKNWRIDVSSSTTRRWKYLPSSSLVGYSKYNSVSFNKNNSVVFYGTRDRPRHASLFPSLWKKGIARGGQTSFPWPLLDSIHTRSSTWQYRYRILYIVIILSQNSGPSPYPACAIFVILLFFIIT